MICQAVCLGFNEWFAASTAPSFRFEIWTAGSAHLRSPTSKTAGGRNREATPAGKFLK